MHKSLAAVTLLRHRGKSSNFSSSFVGVRRDYFLSFSLTFAAVNRCHMSPFCAAVALPNEVTFGAGKVVKLPLCKSQLVSVSRGSVAVHPDRAQCQVQVLEPAVGHISAREQSYDGIFCLFVLRSSQNNTQGVQALHRYIMVYVHAKTLSMSTSSNWQGT